MEIDLKPSLVRHFGGHLHGNSQTIRNVFRGAKLRKGQPTLIHCIVCIAVQGPLMLINFMLTHTYTHVIIKGHKFQI